MKRSLLLLPTLLVALASCDKPEAKKDVPAASSGASGSSGAVASAGASAAASGASPADSASAAGTASAAASAAPVVSMGAFGGKRPEGVSGGVASASASASVAQAATSASAKAAASGAAAAAGPAASTRVTGNHFAVVASSPGCAVGRECTVALRLEASGGYHVNKEYPYKFTANAAPSVDFLGRDPGGAAVFSKAAGDFTQDGETTCTMSVRFKPTAKGAAQIGGVYKMSVCSAENCQIEQTKIALDLTVP